MNLDWEVKARSDGCSVCEKPFADGQTFQSVLSFGAEGYVRVDRCVECGGEDKPAQIVSAWRSAFRLPPPPPEETMKKETAESLLRQFIEDEDPSHANAIYILAVMLERRRIFVERDVQLKPDGGRAHIYEHRKTGEMFIISDPGLKLTDLSLVQEEVVGMLGGKPPDAAPTSAESEDAGS